MPKSFFSRSSLIRVFMTLCGVIVFSACNPSYQDWTEVDSVQPLALPKADYNVPVWLSDKYIVFEYAHDPNAKTYEEELALYDLESKELQPFTFEKPDDCFTARYGAMRRLPDGNFGFMVDCFSLETGDPGRIFDTLYIWDVETGLFRTWHQFPDSFSAAGFSFSPEMSQLMVEQPNLLPRLYRVNEGGEMTPLLSHFWRVRSPGWSPDGKTIVFTGTEVGPSEKSSVFTGLVRVGNVLSYPWDIYLMNADGSGMQLLLSGIEGIGSVKWSPNGEWIAFNGIYEKTPGIWILNVATHQLIRVWAVENASYDWSPNGEQMVIIELKVETDNLGRQIAYGYPLIIDVPVADLK